MKLHKLSSEIVKGFNIAEIQQLCFELGFSHDAILSSTREEMARELVSYCSRRQELDNLLKILKEKRPKVLWSESFQGKNQINNDETAVLSEKDLPDWLSELELHQDKTAILSEKEIEDRLSALRIPTEMIDPESFHNNQVEVRHKFGLVMLSSKPIAAIEFLNGKTENLWIFLTKAIRSISVGRFDADVCVHPKDSSVSRRHFNILVDTESTIFGDVYSVKIVDVGSRNGTYLNKVKIKPYEKVQIQDGDKIWAGALRLIVHFL